MAKTDRITFDLPLELSEALRQKAESEDLSIAHILRRIVRESIKPQRMEDKQTRGAMRK